MAGLCVQSDLPYGELIVLAVREWPDAVGAASQKSDRVLAYG